jgi:hypothetical protein
MVPVRVGMMGSIGRMIPVIEIAAAMRVQRLDLRPSAGAERRIEIPFECGVVWAERIV